MLMCAGSFMPVGTCVWMQNHVPSVQAHVPVGVYEFMYLLVCAGSTDGKVHSWSTETGAKIAILSSDHPGPIQNMQFNPKYMMMATACTNMVSVTSLQNL